MDEFSKFLEGLDAKKQDSALNGIVDAEYKRLSELFYIKKKIEELNRNMEKAEERRQIAFKRGQQEEYILASNQAKAYQKQRQKFEKEIYEQAKKNTVSQYKKEEEEFAKLQKRKIEAEAFLHTTEMKRRTALSKKKKEEYDKQIKNAERAISSLDKQIEKNNKLLNIDKKRADEVKKIKEEAQKEYNLSKSLLKGPTLGNKAEGARLHTSTKTKEYADLLRQKEEERNELGRQGRLDESTLSNYNKEMTKLKWKELGWGTLSNMTEKIGSLITSTINKGLDQVNQAIQDVTSHRTHIMTRLQGVGGSGEYNYSGLMDTVAKNLAVSPYITQRAFMQKLDEAVDKGIAYNVEQRAFLSTIKDEIATTFDAFDSNLLRIIKLQQADSTAARLGMEASLTRTLNSVFQDSSYLTDKIYENVRGALVEAESTMGRNQSTEFEYTVQKWLGALYSLGASSELISQIAQGLNYLGTGNVQALAGNSPLQTLFAMSASRAKNVDYADLLVGGLTTEKTNELLKSMVEYLKEIAEDNKKNNVVKSAYGSIYNMSLADMTAITSLTSTDISSLYSQNMSYGGMTDELARQFNNISKRLSTSEMIKNVVDNFVYSLGSEITQNAATYVMWQITDLIQQSTGGIHLPAISVFGNMVDLSAFTVEGIMKSGIVGLATLGQIGNIFSSIGNNGGLNLDAWKASETMQRGQIESVTAGSVSSTSGSTYVGSSSSSDMKKSSIAGATEESKEVSEITNASSEEEFTVSDLYTKIYKDRTPVPIEISTATKLGEALDLLASYMLNTHRVTDVNIKQADLSVPVTMTTLDSKLKEEIKNYIKTVYVELLASELKESLIGQTRGIGGATIAKVCDKIMNDKVDVQVKNDGFDMFLANSYALHG